MSYYTDKIEGEREELLVQRQLLTQAGHTRTPRTQVHVDQLTKGIQSLSTKLANLEAQKVAYMEQNRHGY